MNAPLVFTLSAERNSPILRFLDARKVPWRDSVRVLVDRFGIKPDPWYKWDSIQIETEAPFLEGLKVGLATYADSNLTASVPLVSLSCQIHIDDDEFKNFDFTVRQLERALGSGSDCSVSNTKGRRWDDGYASLEALIWPRRLQARRQSNPAQERNPFLATSCHVGIKLKYLLPLSEEELRWSTSFQRLKSITGDISLGYRHWEGAQFTREFMRRLDQASSRGNEVGVSVDGKALMTAQDGILNIYPLSRIKSAQFETIPDERGGQPTHRLSLKVPRDFGATGAVKDIEAASQIGGEPDELKALTAAIVERL